MKIEAVEKLTKEHADHLFYWREQVFPVEGKNILWASPKWHLLAFIDGSIKPVAHLGYADFTLSLDGQPEKQVVGVGGVVVRPEFQGKNIPSKLFNFLHNSEHARELSEIFTLFCPERLENYYQNHGYSKFNGAFTFFQNSVNTSADDFIFMSYGMPLLANKIQINGEPW